MECAEAGLTPECRWSGKVSSCAGVCWCGHLCGHSGAERHRWGREALLSSDVFYRAGLDVSMGGCQCVKQQDKGQGGVAESEDFMPESLEAGLPAPIRCVLKSSYLITATLSLHSSACVCVHPQAMWLYLAALVGLYYLLRWYRERQVVSHLRDKYVFITGCGSGFGNLLARQLDTRGFRVLAACRTEEAAEQLKAQTSHRLETVTLDVTKTENIAAVTQWVKERVGDGGLWGLVNNAGTAWPTAPNQWLTKQDFVTVLNVNLLGMIEVTLSLLPLVRKARGRVVNVSSMLGRVSLFGGGYCISKYGVEAFSDSLRRELAHFGVKVVVIEPGYFETNMTNSKRFTQMTQKIWDHASPEIKEIYGQEFLASSGHLEKDCSLTGMVATVCSGRLIIMKRKLKSEREETLGLWPAG
ncbi:retinol dehydrogenase 16-like isoform X2 [Nycticebus coucang]|uniref:retinol dehydrogenase 16-like isoform X2 n=1 Tax=Nycticebus coucang TaxID=9470 RepID=UPI00234CE065|nr:retinol dehydrogenase 16-like isoform X2 [Nycticebus coucang]